MTSGSPSISASGIPWNIAKAYGAGLASPVARVAATQPVVATTPVGRVGPVQSEPRSGGGAGLDRLVAAIVPGKVDFSGSSPAPAPGDPLPFYRHPGDRNEAATFLRLGAGLDVQG